MTSAKFQDNVFRFVKGDSTDEDCGFFQSGALGIYLMAVRDVKLDGLHSNVCIYGPKLAKVSS